MLTTVEKTNILENLYAYLGGCGDNKDSKECLLGPRDFTGSHNTPAPRDLVEDMLMPIPNLQNKNFIVLFNLEFPSTLIHTYDISPNNITLVSDHINKTKLATNYLQCRSIDDDKFNKGNLTMKNKCIVGNPPYQLGKNSDFYIEFVKKSAEILDDGEELAFVIPNRFILSHTEIHKVLNENFEIKELWVDVNDYFKRAAQLAGAKPPGTNIGYVYAVRRKTGHGGLTKIKLADNKMIDVDLKTTMIPSKMPTTEGIKRWNALDRTKTFKFTNNQPTDENYVFVWRQWKSINGKPYFDAEIGGNNQYPGKDRDGKYIVPDKITIKDNDGDDVEIDDPNFDPVAVADYLRNSGIGEKIYELWGDQMNIWPPLWSQIPKP